MDPPTISLMLQEPERDPSAVANEVALDLKEGATRDLHLLLGITAPRRHSTQHFQGVILPELNRSSVGREEPSLITAWRSR